MIGEERIYTLKIGALGPYKELYLAEGLEVQKQILGNLLGYYFTEVGMQNQVVHLWGYDSFEEHERRRAELFQHPDWLADIKKCATLVERQENRILKPLF